MNFNTDWEKVKLGEIGDVVTGKTPSTSEENNFGEKYPFVTPKDMNKKKYILETERFLSEEGIESVKNSIIEGVSVCVSCIGSDMGEVVMVEGEVITNQQINSITNIKDNYNPDFVYYCLKPMKNYFHKIAGGSTMPILNKKDFSNIKVRIPSLEKQKEIADILSSLDDKIELNKKTNQTLEEIAQAIYKSWFVDFEPFQDGEFIDSELGKIPKGWEVGTIGELTKVQNGYAFKSKNLKEEGCAGVIKIRNVKESVDIAHTQFISKSIEKEIHDRYKIKSNSILIALTGEVGRIGLVPKNKKKLYLNQRVGMLKPKSKTKRDYLYCALSTDYYRKMIEKRAGGSVQQNVSATAIEELSMIVPPEEIMNNFSNIIRDLILKISENYYENYTLKNLRDTLLPKLMSGEIRVNTDK